ncbi:MAG: hypothetical protein II928_01740 [Paludibacteraceae bacterium]|nr:hypothetical protein [Paludibacteraceae bacterium]
MLLSCLVLFMSLAAMGQTYTLTYEGFPYMKTACEAPRYAAGEKVRLSSGQPNIPLQWFMGWQYNGEIYYPSGLFTMPAEDVVLVPLFKDIKEGIEDANGENKSKNRKFIRDGQLLIESNGVIYNVLGAKVKIAPEGLK